MHHCYPIIEWHYVSEETIEDNADMCKSLCESWPLETWALAHWGFHVPSALAQQGNCIPCEGCWWSGTAKHWKPNLSSQFANQKQKFKYVLICYKMNQYDLIGGSLEVKLPTIWTREKQSRAEAESRERLEERRSEEKESAERRCRCAKR